MLCRNTRSGKLFEAILTSSDVDSKAEVPDVAESSLIDSVFLHNKKALDLVLGEERIHYLEESSFSSPDGSIASEPGDPLYNESLLKDLFYTTPVSCSVNRLSSASHKCKLYCCKSLPSYSHA